MQIILRTLSNIDLIFASNFYTSPMWAVDFAWF